ncbi:MAG: CHAT domain-containing protein [Steroidobacteraceae bacterium]|nr:CHAT domain-containing protein [Steroidobacteraceae bacterium]
MPHATACRRAPAYILPCIAAALTGCGSAQPPRVVLAETCRAIDASRPVSLEIRAPEAGLLRVAVEQRGISVLATLTSEARAAAVTPIDRFGVISFAPHVSQDGRVTVHVQSRDAPDIAGAVCISAEALSGTSARRQLAERAFAAAGAAMNADSPTEAFERYRDAARAFDGIDRKRTAEARHAMAEIAYSHLRRDQAAFVLAGWALADLGHAAFPGERGALVTLQARALLESQRFPPAVRRARVLETLRAAESLFARTPYAARESPRFDILRGFMEYRTGNSPLAVRHFTQAAKACEALKDWECAARARQNIASLAEEARDFTVALQAYHDALQSLPPELNPKLTADIWGNYGRLQGTAGLFRESERSHRISMRLHAEIANCDGTRISVARLGTLLVQVGSIGDGHAYLARAASLDCRALIASARREAAAESGRASDAGPSKTSSPVLSPSNAQSGPPCVGMPEPESLSELGRLAVFHALLGMRDAFELENEPIRAQECLIAARAYASTARTRLRLANAEGASFLQQGKVEEAAESFQRGLGLADSARLPQNHENRSLAYVGLARAALLAGKPEKVRQYARRSLALGSARADVSQVVESLQLMARSFGDESGNDIAIGILRTAAGLIEQVPIDDLDAEQRATWLATQHTVFAELTARFAARAGNDEAHAWTAFNVSERGRARSIRYALNQATDVRSTSSTEQASVRYQQLMRHIAALAEKANSTSHGDISLDALGELARAHHTGENVSNPEALQKRIRELNATIVEYATARDNMLAFVIDGSRIHMVPLASRQDISDAAAVLYGLLRNPESARADVQRAARRVAELALWPLTQYVGTRRVIFVPDDALHTVPFAVLPWNASDDAALVVERVELSVIPSTLFVTRMGNEHTRPRAARFELIGDPVFRMADWRQECLGHKASPRLARLTGSRAATRAWQDALPRLPGSRKEIAAIATLARKSSRAAEIHERLGCDATPAALRAAAANHPALLHIATHGHVDAYRPRLSALALTPEAPTSTGPATFGLLDILNMDVDSRLVVLSACETSRGRLLPGEGVLGPAQAFLQAGADSVVASYWRIPDEATAPFMEAFYRYLLVEGFTAAAALRQAQLDHARAGTSYDWAAFTLYGVPDTTL